MMIPGSKGQKAVHACMIRLLNLGPAKRDLRSKSADFECLQNCESCFALVSIRLFYLTYIIAYIMSDVDGFLVLLCAIEAGDLLDSVKKRPDR